MQGFDICKLEPTDVGLCRDHNWPVISACIGLGFRSSLANIKVLKFIQLKMQTMLSKKEKLKNCFIYRIIGPIMVVTWEGLVCHKLTLLRTMTHLLSFP